MSGDKAKSNGLKIMIIVMVAIIVALVVIIAKISTDKPSDPGRVVINTSGADGTPGVMTALPHGGDTTGEPYDPSKTDSPEGQTGAPATGEVVTPIVTATPVPTATKKPSGDLPLVDYTGIVEHVFTHSLVAFPELGYPKDISDVDKVMNTYFIDCITVPEFKAILQALYDDGYMLVNINYVYEKDSNGIPRLKKTFKFPEGKKPLVFSFDDTCYYSNKMGRGMIDKLIIIDGKIGTYTKHKDGTVVQGFDEEHIPILDRFVEEHPDFSFNGAKGMICLTGYDGILGYRTQRVSEGDGRTEADRQREIEAVKPIIQLLKDTGWYFASHSYKHGVMEKYSTESMEDCAYKFQNEVIPLIGETKIYVYPYGSWKRSSDGKTCPGPQRVLNDLGFEYFCSVGANWYANTRADLGNVILQDRANIDGTAFVWFQDLFTTHEETGKPRFPSINFREIYDDARNISYDDAVAAYKKWKGIE
ncbi:MAG: hydrolase [Clostridia bacterium]|nr:hydrolase [Clostridia bacterium]